MTTNPTITETTVEQPNSIPDLQDLDVDKLLPTMTVNTDIVPKQESIVGDGELLGLYKEVLEDVRKDRDQIDEVLGNFIEMVMNEGDASAASKEAIVNLMKIKSDAADKKAKIADLMTRIKLKDHDTFPKYLAAQQNNKVVIETGKRDLLKFIQKKTAELKDETKH